MEARKVWIGAAGLAFALAAREALRHRHFIRLEGKVVLITGGSRGLGFLLARLFASRGSRVAICARNQEELDRARDDIEQEGSDVLVIRCDVSDRSQVDDAVAEVTERLGPIDILVNNAGVIQVGPVHSMKIEDFETAMNVMFWGVLYPTMAVLPNMRERRSGRIVNITSIGGKVSIPHLLPYNCAKFAAVALSEGLRAELKREGIRVVTIVPGLMRTGSYWNASFKGRQRQESAWFGLSATLPLLSMSAQRAARKIVKATQRGEAERILSVPAKLLALFHGMFPGVVVELLGFVNRMLPDERGAAGRTAARGIEVMPRTVALLGRSAARRFHQYRGSIGSARGGLISMNWDLIEGKWKQFQGQVKQKWGKLTDDDLTVIGGRRDQFLGKLQERYGMSKEQAERELDDWMRRQKAA